MWAVGIAAVAGVWVRHGGTAREGSPAAARAPAASTAASAADGPALAAIGRALFNGERPIAGRIQGHDDTLPTEASRCSNCHGARAGTPVASSPAVALVPVLDAAHLVTPQPRRGGPPSHYDGLSLCTLLRTGVDPAAVLIDRVMPRYDIDAAACDALWHYLVSPDRVG